MAQNNMPQYLKNYLALPETNRRRMNMLGTVVAQEYPETVPYLAKTSQLFNPGSNPMIRFYFFQSEKNVLGYLKKYKNPMEEIRRLLCEENIMVPIQVIVYIVYKLPNNNPDINIQLPDINNHYKSLLEFIKCISKEISFKYIRPLNILFHLIARKVTPETLDTCIQISNELLDRGFTVDYIPTGSDEIIMKLGKLLRFYVGMTPVSCAIRFNNPDYLTWLLEHGGNLREDDIEYLLFLLIEQSENFGESLASSDKLRRLFTFLQTHEININTTFTFVDTVAKQSLLSHLIELQGTGMYDVQDNINFLIQHGAREVIEPNTEMNLENTNNEQEGGRLRRGVRRRKTKRAKRARRTRRIKRFRKN